MPRTRPTIVVSPPFGGVVTDQSARSLPPNVATDVDNILFRDGNLQCRPGLEQPNGGGTIPYNAGIKSMRYVGGDVDYMIAVSSSRVYVQRYNENHQPAAWTELFSVRALIQGNGGIGRYDKSSHLGFLERNMVFRGELDYLTLTDSGMEQFQTDSQTITGVTNTGETGLHDDVTVWISRYNKYLNLESNAVKVGTISSSTDDGIDIKVTAASYGLIGDCTHVRIYSSRNTGRGYPGLMAEVAWESKINASDEWEHTLNVENGGSTYDPLVDTTNYSFVPCTMNGLAPPAIGFAFHQGRMFYLGSDNSVWFSQNVEELQAGVEAVGVPSFRPLPRNEDGVAIIEYRDAIYVFTDVQIHRISGSVSSLTNSQIVQGSDVFDDISTDVIDALEGTAGAISRDAILEVSTPTGSLVFYAGNENIYMFDGTRSIPVSLNRVQDTYQDNLAAMSDRHQVSAAHMKRQNLVLFCFKDVGCMGYDYVLNLWTFWDTFPTATDTPATFFGPITTRSTHRDHPQQCVILREDASDSTQLRLFGFCGEITQDDGVEIVATWTGPKLDLGHPDFLKRFFYYTISARYKATGTLEAYTKIGEAEIVVPKRSATTSQRAQSDLLAYPLVLELKGVRSLMIQPVVVLTGNSVVDGYSLTAKVVGRR